MNIKKLLATLALSTFALNASAWVVTFSGVIDYGYDNTGVFGMVNQNLAGMTFTQKITASTNPAQWTTSSGNTSFKEMSGFGPAFTNTVTVNGFTVTFDIASTSYGRQRMGMMPGSPYEISTEQRGLTANGDETWGYQYALSTVAPFVPSIDFDQTINHTGVGLQTYAHFTITGQRNAHFFSYNNSFVINDKPVIEPPKEVSEPASLGLLFSALGLFGLARLRKQRTA